MRTILLLTFALLLPSWRGAAQTFAVQPAQRTVTSGIATNQWSAVTNATNVKSIWVQNNTATDYWLFIYDSRTNQLNGAAFTWAPVKVLARTAVIVDPTPTGVQMFKGVTIAQSTTIPALTNVADANAGFLVTVFHTP